jgi:putative drug exporter of the RND superfamily
MFESIAKLVIRRGGLVLLAWLVCSGMLHLVAPPWDQVSKDDDVRFFPPGSPSVVGQELLERGFPLEASSSQVVVIAERRRGHLTSSDFVFVDQLVAKLNRVRERKSSLGIKKVDYYRTPVIGPRLIGTSQDGAGQAVLTIASLNGTYLAKSSRLAVDRLQAVVRWLSIDGFGLEVQPMTPELAKSHGFSEDIKGLLVSSVEVGSPADVEDIAPGDVITEVVSDHKPQPVSSVKDFQDLAAKANVLAVSVRPSKGPSRFVVLRKVKPPKDLGLALTGSAVVGHDMNNASTSSIANTTKATILLVVVILLVVYRSPLLAAIPLVTIGLSVWTSMRGIAELTKIPGLNFQVINITNIFVTVVLFGAGTDYCLFLIARYREELIRGRDRDDALREAIAQVGGALVASAGTVIIGLGMLWFSSFAKIQYTGPAIALSLAIALVASLTLAPVLLHWFRAAVFWPFRQPHHEAGADRERESLEQLPLSGFWLRVADLVVRHPVTILTLCILALIPFAIIGARTRSNYSQLADLNPDQASVIGAQIVQRYFAVGELSPSAVLVEHPKLSFRSDEGRDRIDKVCRRIIAIPNVAEVRSVSQPLGKPPVPESEKSMLDRFLERTMRAAVDSRYVSLSPTDRADRNHITRIDVVFKTDPFSDQSLRALETVCQTVREAMAPGQPLGGGKAVGLAGATASVNDLKKVTTSDERRMYVLVTLGVYAILVLLLRRPFVCLYLIVTVVLGYLASLGMTELVFKAMHRGPDPWVGLDWKVGFFLFVILVAVGEDYNIFLMSRVIEEERKHGLVEGTRRAIAHTGGIISSCGLIMAGTFGSMLTGNLTALRELGFALGLGVLLDTFLVRPILVPAFVVLADRYRPLPLPRSRTVPRPTGEGADAVTAWTER